MVAPSFVTYKVLTETPFLKNGKLYITVEHPNTHNSRDVRWYSQEEYNKAYGKKDKNSSFGKYRENGLQTARGFKDGPILLIRNDSPKDKQWLEDSVARYAVDFGWYYFLTKPFFYILDYLYQLLGNMGWAILLFAALLRLALFPIANKSFESMSKMRKVQPKIMAIQAMYKDNKAAQQRATMELYRKEKINPAAGCLPMLIQIPVFFSLYKVLVISLEIRHAPFIGWIKDLSAPDPLTISQWAHIWVPAALDIGIWPLIYGLTMYLQNKLNPKPANKDQASMFALMPLIFMFMFAHFAVGLIIYWTLSNILSMIQQRVIMYKNGVK